MPKKTYGSGAQMLSEAFPGYFTAASPKYKSYDVSKKTHAKRVFPELNQM